jgi:hypothetical protein
MSAAAGAQLPLRSLLAPCWTEMELSGKDMKASRSHCSTAACSPPASQVLHTFLQRSQALQYEQLNGNATPMAWIVSTVASTGLEVAPQRRVARWSAGAIMAAFQRHSASRCPVRARHGAHCRTLAYTCYWKALIEHGSGAHISAGSQVTCRRVGQSVHRVVPLRIYHGGMLRGLRGAVAVLRVWAMPAPRRLLDLRRSNAPGSEEHGVRNMSQAVSRGVRNSLHGQPHQARG